MNNNLVKEITATQLRTDLPVFTSGDTVRVYVRIIENNKQRLQAFEGIVMGRRGEGMIGHSLFMPPMSPVLN